MKHFAVGDMTVVSPAHVSFEIPGLAPAHEQLNRRMGDNHCRALLDSSPDCIVLLDLVGRLLWMNANGLQRLEIADPDSLVGQPWASLWPRSFRAGVSGALRKALDEGTARFTGRCPTATGLERWWDVIVSRVDAHGDRPIQFAAISRDVTDHRTAIQQLRSLANHDSLTGLPNRRSFHEDLGRRLAARPGSFALVMLDLDRFKQTNDKFGHEVGDALLRTCASRLAENLRSDDFAARLGGDEFALILGGIVNATEAIRAVQSILARVCAPFRHGEQTVDCHASAGIAIFPDHGEVEMDLSRSADIALYAAKAGGRGRCRCFDREMQQALQRRMSMLELARAVLSGGWIRPFYQPKIDLETQEIRGFEALLRWQRPGGAVQLPDTIWEALDDPDLSSPISDKMIDSVIADMTTWQKLGMTLPIAINASAADFRRGDFADGLLDRLDRAGIPPTRMEIEVTETVFLGPGAVSIEGALRKLSAAGMRIALDDFGTGYASLSRLKQFPVDVLKIDRSFVRNILTDPDDRVIVGTMASLGASMSIEIVAEGIENAQQARLLRMLRCDTGQGLFHGNALPANAIPALVRRCRTRQSAGTMPHAA